MQKKDILTDLPKLPDVIESKVGEEKEEKYSYTTVNIRKDLMEKVKNYVYWNRLTQQEFFVELLEDFFEDKKLKPMPEKVLKRRKR